MYGFVAPCRRSSYRARPLAARRCTRSAASSSLDSGSGSQPPPNWNKLVEQAAPAVLSRVVLAVGAMTIETKTKVEVVGGQVGEVKQQLADFRADVKEQVGGVKQQLGEFKADVKEQVGGFKQQLAEVKADVMEQGRRTDQKLDLISQQLMDLAGSRKR
jgi:hypothetical protein